MSDTIPAPDMSEPDVPGESASVAPGRPQVQAGISLRNNPVLRRELVERVRGVKVVLFVTAWLALLIAILWLAYQGSVAISQGFGPAVNDIGRIGRQIFEWVLFGMLILVLFLVPGLTAGAITGERERQTLVPLQMTMMRPRDIIIGKLSAALAFLVLLVVAAMPLLGVSFLIGGFTLWDILRGLLMLIFTGLVLGSMCVAISSRLRRTTAATVLSYGLAFVFAVGSFFAMAAWSIASSVDGGDGEPPAELLAFSPFAAVGDSLPRGEGALFFQETISPFGGMRSLIDGLGQGDQRFDEDGRDIDDRGPRIWIYYVVIGTVLMVGSVRVSSRAVSTPADSER